MDSRHLRSAGGKEKERGTLEKRILSFGRRRITKKFRGKKAANRKGKETNTLQYVRDG